MIDEILKQLGFSDKDIKVYNTLVKCGIITAGEIAKKTDIPRSSVYGILSRLQREGIVKQIDRFGVKYWGIDNPRKVELLIDSKQSMFSKLKEKYIKHLPFLENKYNLQADKPHLFYYEGKKAVQQALKDMLLYRDLETEAFWPINEMIKVLGVEFFIELNIRRIRQNLYTRAIWPQNSVVDIKEYTFLGVGDEFKREIRIAPSGVLTTMGYWAYGDRVVFISSDKELFGFVIQSKDMRQMLKTQFDIIWSMSKPLRVNIKHTKLFLEKYINTFLK